MAGLRGLYGAMGGGAGISQGLQAASPLLMAMSAGLNSGQGAMAGLPIGLAGMMDLKRQRQEEADKAAAKAAYGALGAGAAPGGIPAAMGAQNAPTGGVVGGMGRQGQGMFSPAVPASASSGGKPEILFAEFQKHGVPDHIAYGALGNFKQESGFNPVAYNKGEGAFGMGQWRGERLDNLKKFSAANGMDPSDPKAQVAFTVHEWKTTEKGAWDKIAQSRNPAEAAAAIDQHYERSSGQHREARVKNAMELAQGWQGQFGEAQVADPAADPQVRQMLGYLAQYGDSPQAAAVKAQLEMRVQQIQSQGQGQGLTDMQAAQLGMQEAAQQPGALSPKDRFQNVPGVGLVDLYAEGGPAPVLTGTQEPMSGAGKLKADLDAGRISQAQFDAEMSRGNLSFETITNPDGTTTTSLGMGSGQRLKPLTEGQSKDNYYLTAIDHAGPILDQYEGALSGISAVGNEIAGMVPFGEFAQTPEYQQAMQAVAEWGAPVLRKESGAALTAPDYKWLTDRYIPVAGDKPQVIEQKRQSRKAAEAGLRSGMTDEQINSVAKALKALRPELNEDQRKAIVQETAGYPDAPKIGAAVEGHRFAGGDPADPASWVK
jgi:hypothetical protein